NICVSKLAIRLGAGRLHRALRRFGFGAQTKIGLPGERRGTLRDPKRWSTVGLANISFGQGMTSTVLQLAQALTAIGNDGKLMKPRLVLRIKDRSGRVVRTFKPQGKRVLSPQLARRMRFLLRGVVQKGGTAEDAALDRFTVAGKTGTAQKVDPLTGTYSNERWLSSFIAVTPASRPRLAVAVVINEPSGEEHYGGPVAGPVFKRIASKALRYLGVRPDRAASHKETHVARNTPRRSRQPEVDLAPPLPRGDGPRGRHVVPDFTGMSIAEALAVAHRGGLVLEIKGSGQAVAQTPGPGPSTQAHCRIAFSPPG
ncbi:MAG: PASTA domain-containing protein, partial [Deltaproteobacteria bacterium]|nr:PASTA domain-containing protein [Deltaproteobacteria bacterium]